jgi:DNA polymerase-3 subunit chi
VTQVDFYILRGEAAEARLRTACRLAAKAVQLDQHVFIRALNEGEARQLDELLWTFSESSFLPHRVVARRTAPGTAGGAPSGRTDGAPSRETAGTPSVETGGVAAGGTIAASDPDSLEPVHIGVDAGPVRGRWDLLINLGEDVPEVGSRYARIAEIVDADPERRSRGRERYKHYRDRGYKLLTHEL